MEILPVMCMAEMDVPRQSVEMHSNHDGGGYGAETGEINHVFLHDAVQLRPDLVKGD